MSTCVNMIVNIIKVCKHFYILYTMSFNCTYCDKIYKNKKNLHNHVASKHLFDNIKVTNYICKYCNKIFVYRQSKSRHEKTCKKNTNIIIYDNVQQPIVINTNNIINNNITNNVVIQNNIIYNYDYDINKLCMKEQEEILKHKLDGVLKLIEIYNFNHNHPENHIFCVTSLDGKTLKNVNPDTHQIETTNKKYYFYDILMKAIEAVTKIYKKFIKLQPYKKNIYENDLKLINSFYINNFYGDRKKNANKYYDDINRLSYNKKYIIRSTWKKNKTNDKNNLVDDNTNINDIDDIIDNNDNSNNSDNSDNSSDSSVDSSIDGDSEDSYISFVLLPKEHKNTPLKNLSSDNELKMEMNKLKIEMNELKMEMNKLKIEIVNLNNKIILIT